MDRHYRPRKILIIGLPGAGKTTLALALRDKIPGSVWYDGDMVRNITANHDFTIKGRERQAATMSAFANIAVRAGHTAICSFVCPTNALREIFKSGCDTLVVWLDTVKRSRYVDTDAMWEEPRDVWYWPRTKNMAVHAQAIADLLEQPITMPPPPKVFSWTSPSAIMIGRFQPWHYGHRMLFEAALRDWKQVCIMVRTMVKGPNNPYIYDEVVERIHEDLRPHFQGEYHITSAPNTAAVVYGRDVGYAIRRYTLDSDIESVSGSKIREGATGAIGDTQWWTHVKLDGR